MAKKPSFFEKLTGATEIEENEEDLSERETEESEEISSRNKNKLPSTQVSKDKEEWLPESEGQLTIDVYQTPSDIIIKSTIAGVNPEDLDISISNDMVTIKGTREKDEEIKSEDYYYH